MLNYQEPDNWLRRNIKFHKPAQIISFLLLCIYEAQKGTREEHQLKNISLMHLPLLIYILCRVGKGEQRRRSWSLVIFPSSVSVFAEGLEVLLLIVYLCILPFYLTLTTKIISLHSFDCPWICLHWQAHSQLWIGKNKAFRR